MSLLDGVTALMVDAGSVLFAEEEECSWGQVAYVAEASLVMGLCLAEI